MIFYALSDSLKMSKVKGAVAVASFGFNDFCLELLHKKVISA